jgi:hypothetical protein
MWSQMFVTPHPDFQYVQGKLISLYTSQSPTERNHKMEAAMKTKARNRLKSLTTDMLIHVYQNARMKDKELRPHRYAGILLAAALAAPRPKTPSPYRTVPQFANDPTGGSSVAPGTRRRRDHHRRPPAMT